MKHSLKTIRTVLAVISITLVTLLFLDFTGTAQRLFGWMAKIQFLPALLALNFGVVLIMVAATLLLGRVYCSVVCPLGIMQDIFAWLGRKQKRNRYRYSAARNVLRYSFLSVMVVAIAAGLSWIVALLAPYSAYGRIVQSLGQPVWIWINNLLASWAEHRGSYAFYSVDLWLRGWITLAVAVVTLVIVGVLAWRNGRTYCNTVCPVGTVLGALSRFSLLQPVIDTSKCNRCGLCARNCKASCIDSKNHTIDLSRCVACMDCINKCHQGAISYTYRRSKPATAARPEKNVDRQRRNFLGSIVALGGAAAAHAAEKTVDGGVAVITDKKIPLRKTPVLPPGAKSLRHLASKCTACQLCVASCPNGVLRPSTDLSRLMQPESSYERGYCRPECTRCSNVCPTGAIVPLTAADKSAVQIGHAVVVRENCVVLTDGVSCGNCARHCPAGAILMVPSDPSRKDSPRVPAVDTERCIGCGACENLCPARPFSAIYVEGNEVQREI